MTRLGSCESFLLKQLLAGGVQLLVEVADGHLETVDGKAAHTRLDMLVISTVEQEREAPRKVFHKHLGQAHKICNETFM